MTDRKSNSQFLQLSFHLLNCFVILCIPTHLKCHLFSLSHAVLHFLWIFYSFLSSWSSQTARKKFIRQFDVIVFDFMSGTFQWFFSVLLESFIYFVVVSFRSAYLRHKITSIFFCFHREVNIQQINDTGFVVKIRTMQCQTKYKLFFIHVKYGEKRKKCRRLFAFSIDCAWHEKWGEESKICNIKRTQQIIVLSIVLSRNLSSNMVVA